LPDYIKENLKDQFQDIINKNISSKKLTVKHKVILSRVFPGRPGAVKTGRKIEPSPPGAMVIKAKQGNG